MPLTSQIPVLRGVPVFVFNESVPGLDLVFLDPKCPQADANPIGATSIRSGTLTNIGKLTNIKRLVAISL